MRFFPPLKFQSFLGCPYKMPYYVFVFTCAQRQRLLGSRKEKMYKDNTLGRVVVKSRASAGIFS